MIVSEILVIDVVEFQLSFESDFVIPVVHFIKNRS